MAYCSNCGKQLEEIAKFCPACGAKTETSGETAEIPVEQASATETPAPAKASGKLDLQMLIYSIINTVMLCLPLGIASLILTILAKDAPTAEEEAKKLKTAKTCNIIGTLIACTIVLIFVLFCIFLVILAIIMAIEDPYYHY